MRFILYIFSMPSLFFSIPTKEDFIRNSIDLDRSNGWELVSASTIMKNEFKYSGAKFEIVQSYLHAIDILSNPSYNGSYNQNFKIVSLRSVWIPFLFLCRQAVEFSLKNALESTNIEIKGPTHNIKELWDIFVKENKTYNLRESNALLNAFLYWLMFWILWIMTVHISVIPPQIIMIFIEKNLIL